MTKIDPGAELERFLKEEEDGRVYEMVDLKNPVPPKWKQVNPEHMTSGRVLERTPTHVKVWMPDDTVWHANENEVVTQKCAHRSRFEHGDKHHPKTRCSACNATLS